MQKESINKSIYKKVAQKIANYTLAQLKEAVTRDIILKVAAVCKKSDTSVYRTLSGIREDDFMIDALRRLLIGDMYKKELELFEMTNIFPEDLETTKEKLIKKHGLVLDRTY